MSENTLTQGPSAELIKLMDQEFTTLVQILHTFSLDGAKKNLGIAEQVDAYQNEAHTAGLRFYNYGYLQASLKMYLTHAGNTIVETSIYLDGKYIEKKMIFDEEGKISTEKKSEVLSIETKLTFSNCPLLNLMYSYLHSIYNAEKKAITQTKRVQFFEKTLRELSKKRSKTLGANLGANDIAYTKIFDASVKVEQDPVLKWDEKQALYETMYAELNLIKSTKMRAHKISRVALALSIRLKKLKTFINRITKKPFSNLKGFGYQYTFGILFWFLATVKNNLGYSIALAVYGPFTYYFITMPMNPHAMSAVGKLRNSIIELQQEVVHYITKPEVSETKLVTVSDSVSNTQSAPRIEVTATSTEASVNTNQSAKNQVDILANILGISETTQGKAPQYTLVLDGKTENYTPSILNLLLSTDVPSVDSQKWTERMSHFKNMQIAYEENLEFASRMGRLEQLETQYNFPMIAELAWDEMERYLNQIFKYRNDNPNISAKMKQYLFNEVYRTQQLQLYVWDRMNRFIQDQPYVMLDEDNEQQRNDYYVGRAFIFMHEMTNTLSFRYQNLKKPAGFEKVEKLAKLYKENRQELGNIIKNLKANSDLFKQKSTADSRELRKKMKRQWEILYLQNAKAEEGSNNGLNMYIWSVRNAIWTLQSMYSSKRRDLELLAMGDSQGNINAESLELAKIDMQFETLYHNLVLEYTGVREEMSKRFGKDIEFIQRQALIDNLKEAFIDRAKLRNQLTSSAEVQAQAQL